MQKVLRSVSAGESPPLLWSLQYQQQFASAREATDQTQRILKLGAMSSELVLDESIFEDVKAAWMRIAQPEDADDFMKFAARDGTTADEDEEESA